MPITFTENAVVAAPGQQYSLSQWLNVTPGNLPEYLVLTGLDRNRYTAGSAGAPGSLSGNHNVATFAGNAQTGDAANIGVVFSYTAQGYYNGNLGYLTSLGFRASSDNYRSEYLSLYGYGVAGSANDAQLSTLTALSNSSTGNPSLQFVAAPPAGGTALGSLDIVVRSDYVDATPNLATPNEIATVAAGFVGKPWNINGCWVLVSDIAAAAGASLPVNSSVPRSMAPPGANGQWMVAYDSTTATAAQQLTWQTQLRTGDVVGFDGYCGGHIVTVAAGSGYGALMIDNAGISAGDGSPDDIIIESAHGPAEAFSGALAPYVVIYRLDTPVLTPLTAIALSPYGSSLIGDSFSAQDPGGKPIVSYQVYDTGAGAVQGSFSSDGVTAAAHSSASALTIAAASLANTRFSVGAYPGSDSLMVRAFNGAYWGDWQSIDVQVGAGTRAPIVHVATDQTVVRGGGQVSLSSLVTASSPDSPIATYTIRDPGGPATGSGHVQLNGAINMLGSPVDTSQDMVYQVSAEDFAKLTYRGGGFLQNGEALSIVATNAAQQASVAVALQIMNIGLSGSGIAHYLAPGSEIPVAQMFTVSGIDSAAPIRYYIFSLDPTLSDSLNLNGATNLFGSTLINTDGWAHYEIAAADLGRLTYTAGPHTNQYGNELLIAATDGVSTANAFSLKHAALAATQISANPADKVLIGDSVALTSLFSPAQALGNLNFHIYDPPGGGLVNLNGVTNVMGKEALAGEYIISGHDIGQVTYTGGSGQENLLIATSTDNYASWAPELAVAVTGVVNAPTAAGMGAQSLASNVSVIDSAANVAANIDALASLAAAGKLDGITLTDSGTPSLSITPAQLGGDGAALNAIASSFALTISASTANLSINGLPGHSNTVVFSGTAGSLAGDTVTKTGSIYTVGVRGAADSDTLSNVQHLQFSDASVDLTVQEKAAALAPGKLNSLIELYIAYFNRVPDGAGLGYWIDQLASGQTLDQVGTSFYAAAIQYSSGTGYSASMTNADFVTLVYAHVLGRSGSSAPPQADVSYWANNLASGANTRGTLINTMLASAHAFKGDATWGWVADLLDNKDAVARTVAIDMGLSYSDPNQAIAQGMAIAAAVTPTDTSQAIGLIGIDPANLHLT